MKKIVSAFVLVAALSGCATYSPSVPEGYKGPVAIIKDSITAYNIKKANFFYLSEIDGRTIEDSRVKTLRINHGRGMTMTPHLIERNIPATPATFKIVGRTEYAAPILALTGTVYQVAGNVTFTPENYKTYVVRGTLGESYSAVWIEEEQTKKVIGEKIEVRGSTELGAFEK